MKSTKSMILGISTLTIAALLSTASAHADVAARIEAFKKVHFEKDGATRIDLVPVSRAVPGDVIVNVISIRADEDESAGNVHVDVDIDDNMIVSPNSFSSDAEISVLYSTFEDNSFKRLAEIRVHDENGEERPATPEDIDAVRVFAGDLPAGKNIDITFETVLR